MGNCETTESTDKIRKKKSVCCTYRVWELVTRLLSLLTGHVELHIIVLDGFYALVKLFWREVLLQNFPHIPDRLKDLILDHPEVVRARLRLLHELLLPESYVVEPCTLTDRF